MKETLSCFCFGPCGAPLPAFGSFIGNQVIRPTDEDRIYLIADDEIVEMQNRATLQHFSSFSQLQLYPFEIHIKDFLLGK